MNTTEQMSKSATWPIRIVAIMQDAQPDVTNGHGKSQSYRPGWIQQDQIQGAAKSQEATKIGAQVRKLLLLKAIP